MILTEKEDAVGGKLSHEGRHLYARRTDQIVEVRGSAEVSEDFYGMVSGERSLPGPFAQRRPEHKYDLDPRKSHQQKTEENQ